MTDDSDKAQWAHFESAHSAHDGDLADTFALDSSVARDDEVAPGLPTAPSPPRSGARHARKRQPEVEPSPLEVATDETAVLPRLGPDGQIVRGRSLGVPGAEPPADSATRRRSARRRKRKRRKAPWWELPLLVGVAILVAVLVKTFVIQPFYIPSPSMEKTLHGCENCKGDRILVNKPIYDLRDPHPGDIVVFHAPPGWDDEPPSVPPSNPILRTMRGFGQLVGFVPPDGLVLVKRVIAIGGQTIKGVSRDGHDEIMVSDQGPAGPWRTLSEPFTYYDADDSRAEFGPVTVPKGRLWVMGDHRNNSADSRFHCGAGITQDPSGAGCDAKMSTVPVNDVIGKAVVIAWPPSRWRTLGTPATFKNAALSAGAELPTASATAVILPIYLLRRRRRRLP